MADRKTCKRKRKPNWTQEEPLLLAQLVNESKDIIKGKLSPTSSTTVIISLRLRRYTCLKAHYCQMFLKCLYSEADCWQQPFLDSLWFGLSDLSVLFTTPNVSQI